MPKATKPLPIVEAGKPRSWPRIGLAEPGGINHHTRHDRSQDIRQGEFERPMSSNTQISPSVT